LDAIFAGEPMFQSENNKCENQVYVNQKSCAFGEKEVQNVFRYNILIVFKNIGFAKKKKIVYVCATKEFRDGRNSFLFLI